MVVNGSLTGLMVKSEEHSRADYKPIDRWKEYRTPGSKVHGANMGPTWVLSSPGGHHVGPINHAIRGSTLRCLVILILLFAWRTGSSIQNTSVMERRGIIWNRLEGYVKSWGIQHKNILTTKGDLNLNKLRPHQIMIITKWIYDSQIHPV